MHSVQFIFFFALILSSGFGQQCSDEGDGVEPPDCPGADDPDYDPIYFPYPYDCRKFFKCINGAAVCFQCPPGTIWNQWLKSCVHEDLYPCEGIGPTRPSTSTTPKVVNLPNFLNV